MLIQNFFVFFFLKDIDVLYQQQAKALQDPVGFVEKLQNKVQCDGCIVLWLNKMVLTYIYCPSNYVIYHYDNQWMN